MFYMNRVPTHPGEILHYEYLEPLAQTPAGLAQRLGVPSRSIDELVCGKRDITSSLAGLLAKELDTTPEFWLNLQAAHDTADARRFRKPVESAPTYRGPLPRQPYIPPTRRV